MRNNFKRWLLPRIGRLYHRALISKTKNFSDVTWLGYPIWQSVPDLWTIQETLSQVRPALLIETGTNRAGSALFYAHLFDLMQHGEVLSIDVEKLHQVRHPRITFLLGSSTDPAILEQVQRRVAQTGGPVLVILDSDHSQAHVEKELEAYSRFVTVNSYCIVQDGIIDQLPVFKNGRPGPLSAIEAFVAARSDFISDEERANRFLMSQHPKGWLRRVVSES
jgi:cephalosporin hydroxylase